MAVLTLSNCRNAELAGAEAQVAGVPTRAVRPGAGAPSGGRLGSGPWVTWGKLFTLLQRALLLNSVKAVTFPVFTLCQTPL